MFRDDYLIRMIEQMGDVLRKVLSLEDKRQFKEGHQEIDKAMMQLGVSRLLARTMPAKELTRLIERPGAKNDDRMISFSRLLAADAHIYEAEGMHGTAHDLYKTSIEILTGISGRVEDERRETVDKDIDALRLMIRENANGDPGTPLDL